ncbi:MAG: MFS transporter [Dehalococcoidia bacterium]|nr:MFS transporter [Dehalococcoidia bacterium]
MSLPSPEAHHGEPVSRRATVLALFARFTDELLFGAADVLMPTIRSGLGLSYAQVGALKLALDYVAYVVDPLLSLLIDAWRRRWLLAGGALLVGVATALVGLAPTFLVLLVAFALYGIGAGPLAYTADVILVESPSEDPRRIFARATALDTFGALLGPALVAAWLWAGLEWRWLMVSLGSGSLVYAAALARTAFPDARHARTSEGLLRHLRQNLGAVLVDREAVTWLVCLRIFYVFEAPTAYRSIWLVDEAGMSQQLVGIYVAFVTACSLAGVLTLERWLSHVAPRRLLLANTAALLVLFPLWFQLPGIAARFLVGAPLAFLFAMIWPIARGASLTTASARPGAVTAVNSLTGVLPVTFAIGLLAERVGLTAASLGVHFVAGMTLLLMAWRWLPREARAPS